MNTHWNCFYHWTLFVVCRNQHLRKKITHMPTQQILVNILIEKMINFWLSSKSVFDRKQNILKWIDQSILCHEISNKNPQLFFWTKSYCFEGETKIHFMINFFQNDEKKLNYICTNESGCQKFKLSYENELKENVY
jgi:hypothetical protein